MVQYSQINKCYTSHKRKAKNHIIISIDVGKAFDKLKNPFVIKKNTQPYGSKVSIPLHNKGHIKKPTGTSYSMSKN